MKLQLALDRLTREECLFIIHETEKEIDWIEVGTSVIKEYGMSLVREIRELYPDKMIVVDMKTLDTGGHEAIQSFEAGADITTVMAIASDRTITDTLEIAAKYGKRVMVDLLEVTSKSRVQQLKGLGVDLVGVHIGKDKQVPGKFDKKHFSIVKDFDLEVSVAGGIDFENLPGVLTCKPDIVIVGSTISKASNSKYSARRIKDTIT
ncbi:3-hexulose-6-phosphate synthase [Oceanobacillus jeddahense]|uniref:3-hexulose-6-phosphate synthase n=1 Tax=Oceanobacillus jeddahense TaxID=1462527 RepID=UPI00362F6691